MPRRYQMLLLLFVALCAAFSFSSAQAESTLASDFSPWQQWSDTTAVNTFDMNRCKTLQAADVNGDGRTDLICPYDYGSARTATFVQISSGSSFSPWQQWSDTTAAATFDMNRCKTLQMGDVNDDGRSDLICPYDYGSASTDTFVQISSGSSFSPWQGWSDKTAVNTFDMNRCKTLQAADVNGDGRTDLICPYDYGSASTATFVQISSGSSFSPWQRWSNTTAVNTFDMNRCKTLQAADVNGDGRTDLICPLRLRQRQHRYLRADLLRLQLLALAAMVQHNRR